MTEDHQAAEIRAAGCDLTDVLARHIWDHNGPLRLGSGRFRPLYAEEARALGYADDDRAVLLLRESDDQAFEVDIDVTLRRIGGAP